MNGIEFLKYIRAMHPELPFILFTGPGQGGSCYRGHRLRCGFVCPEGWGVDRSIRRAAVTGSGTQSIAERQSGLCGKVKTGTGLLSRPRPNSSHASSRTGTHIFVNEAYCRYFSKTAQEILGTSSTCPSPPRINGPSGTISGPLPLNIPKRPWNTRSRCSMARSGGSNGATGRFSANPVRCGITSQSVGISPIVSTKRKNSKKAGTSS